MKTMQIKLLLSILLFEAVMFLLWLSRHTYSSEPALIERDVRQESGTVDEFSNGTYPNETTTESSSVATVTDEIEPLTDGDLEGEVFSLFEDIESDPDKGPSLYFYDESNPENVISLSTNTESNPDEVSSASANTERNPDNVISLSTHTESKPDQVSSASIHTESNPDTVSSLSANTESDAGRVISMAVDTDSDRDKPLSPYMFSLNETIACKAAKQPGKHPLILTPDTKLILLWQDEQDTATQPGSFRSLCASPTVGPCQTTTDLSYRSRADAVVIHASRLFSPTLPFPKLPGQIWIARGLESPVHWYASYKSPQWRGVFNWTFTYRPDSDLFSPIGHLIKMPAKGLYYRNIAMRKTRSVAWFSNHCDTDSRREDYVKEMRKYIDVDVYGKCGNRRCNKSGKRNCFEILSSTYRFYLAFENSLCNYYITNKFFNKFGKLRMSEFIIPVVRGGTHYRKYFPEDTFIDAADFKSPKALAMYLNKFSNDTEAYAALLSKKEQYGRYICTRGQVWCKMCDMLHNPNIPPKVYDDIGAWWDQEACVKPTDISKS